MRLRTFSIISRAGCKVVGWGKEGSLEDGTGI